MSSTHADTKKRVVALMTAVQKVRLKAKASETGLSVSEFVRRAVDPYDPEEMRQLELLAAALRLGAEKASAAQGPQTQASL